MLQSQIQFQNKDSKPNLKQKVRQKFSNLEIPYNIFLWLILIGFNLTFSVNWLQAVFYLATSAFLALILGNVILRRFSVKFLEFFILTVFIFANLILTFFKQFELFFALYYLTYCFIFVRLFISFRNRLGTTKVWERITRRSLRAIVCFGLLITLPFSYFFITDPFSGGSTIKKPYQTSLQNNQIILSKEQNLRAFNNPFSKALGYLKSGGHIFGANFVKEAGFETNNLEEIISQTHQTRFGPNVPYIISGGHFSVFYPRSLGIFYHAALDPNLSKSEKDWQNRQMAYLKTTAFALDSFKECGDLYTTIVPLGENSITCVQIYHYPSDSLYSVLFALSNLLDNSEYLNIFNPNSTNSNNFSTNSDSDNSKKSTQAQNLETSSSNPNSTLNSSSNSTQLTNSTENSQNKENKIENTISKNDQTSQIENTNQNNSQNNSGKNKFQLQTQTYAKALLETHRENLLNLWQKYKNKSFDEQTGLVKLNVELSGTKDIGLQNGSFYDNVIFWRTWQLMQNLGLEKEDKTGLETLKQRILTTFWNENLGIFAEDQSVECAKSCYSSDWLIILLTGFLKTTNAKERIYYERSVDFIIKNKIDQPFPLRYHNDDRPDKTYPLVRLTNHEYAGTAIWSYWGLEYIKTLYLLGQNNSTQNLNSNSSSSQNFPLEGWTQSGLGLVPLEQSEWGVFSSNSNNSQSPNPNYTQIADQFLAKYQENILKYGGFPEVYDSQGKMMEANLYRSVVKTGWIINWEQARAMQNSANEKANN
jgi:hypothetical protein